MDFLPKIFIGAICLLFFLFLPRSVLAVTVASQTQSFSDQLTTHRILQELGNNLSGVAGSFTFRVSTSKTNLNQFDYTIQNTRIFDKDDSNFSIVGCTPTSYNPADPLGGLTFDTSSAPVGFEDVTIDFSCYNYSFIPGHRYLIIVANANYNEGSGLMLLAATAYNSGSSDQFSGGGLRYSNGNKFDFAHNGGSCSGIAYQWNDQTQNPTSGCNIWTSAKDDLYFILKNTAPEPTPTPTPAPSKNPVIFIPGIGGSELKAAQDIIWSKDDGHGGTFSHAYLSSEKIWVNQDEAAKLGDDDYFDVLRLKIDGKTAEASLSLTGDLTSFGYGEIDSFFTDMGYTKGTNFFVFPYDWRKDVRESKDGLDALVEQAKTKSGQSKVNLVVHSMGGLVARYYISDSGKAAKVGKLIELGVPHLGAAKALKTLIYGDQIKKDIFGVFSLGIPSSETKDIFQNLPSAFQLLPANKYFNFYDNSNKNLPYPFSDERDIDDNKITGILNFNQIKTLLTNLSHNMAVFDLGEQFHNTIDSSLDQSNGTKLYLIVGSGQPTLGQIIETWWIKWPIKLIPKREEVFINGDETIPLYSASLKSASQDLSGGAKIYYVEQKHSDLVAKGGPAMQTVKTILNESDAFPVEVKDQKISLEGQHISVDQDAKLDLYDEADNHTGLKANGEIETNIPHTFYDSLEDSKHVFVKKSQKVTVKITSTKNIKADIKIRNYAQDSINKTILYNDVPINNQTTLQFNADPSTTAAPILAAGTTNITATSEITGNNATDQTPPMTKIEKSGTNPVTITLTGSDTDSGILKIEYSLDNGQTVQTYTGPFTISTSGKTTLQVKSIDKLGNEEVPQESVIEITESSSSSSGSSSSGSSSSDRSTSSNQSNSSTSEVKSSNTSKVGSDSFLGDEPTSKVEKPVEKDILGISTQNPVSSAQLANSDSYNPTRIDLLTSSMLVVALFMTQGGMILLSSLGSVFSFFKPTPK